MLRPKRFIRRAVCLIPLTCALFGLAAAAPAGADAPDDLVRRANELLRAGDPEAADKLYAAAEEHTTDPGLVAFNRASVLFEQKNYREAERHYDRVLSDVSCPAVRAARAWYNRGTCLLHRGGTIDVYRAAIACFENALDIPSADQEVRDRAPHNLELAKLLWNEKRKEAAKPEEQSPNNNPPVEDKKQPRPESENTGAEAGNTGAEAGNTGTQKRGLQPQPVPQPKGDAKSAPTEQNVPANNPSLQVPADTDDVQKLTPDEARAYLAETAKRRKRELRSLLESLYGPDRAGAQDR
jgi:tetratricopeptide (TPR) repeat protein